MLPISYMKLEDRFTAAGNALSQPLSSLKELLRLLNRIEQLLSRVEQSPAKPVLTALSPLMDALIAENFLKHSDDDVRGGVASCISEIIRITAPDAPYDDDKMKEVFHLIVSTFEDLSNTASRSHLKRVSILKTMAKVRYCVIMLDLEMDQKIIEMFQHFLRAIRVHQSEIIFESMEAVMTLVFEESDDIDSTLLTSIMAAVKVNNEEAQPNTKKLAGKVIQNCAEKLRPYLTQVLKTSDEEEAEEGSTVSSHFIDNQKQVGQLKGLEFEEGDPMRWISMIGRYPYPTISTMKLIVRYSGRKAVTPYESCVSVLQGLKGEGMRTVWFGFLLEQMDWVVQHAENNAHPLHVFMLSLPAFGFEVWVTQECVKAVQGYLGHISCWAQRKDAVQSIQYLVHFGSKTRNRARAVSGGDGISRRGVPGGLQVIGQGIGGMVGSIDSKSVAPERVKKRIKESANLLGQVAFQGLGSDVSFFSEPGNRCVGWAQLIGSGHLGLLILLQANQGREGAVDEGSEFSSSIQPKPRSQVLSHGEDRLRLEDFFSQRRSELAWKYLCVKFCVCLFDRLPKVWDCLVEIFKPGFVEGQKLDDEKLIHQVMNSVKDFQILMCNIPVVPAIAPMLDTSVRPRLMTLFCIFKCRKNSHIIKGLSAAVNKSMAWDVLDKIIENGSPKLEDVSSVQDAQVAGMLVRVLVQGLSLEISGLLARAGELEELVEKGYQNMSAIEKDSVLLGMSSAVAAKQFGLEDELCLLIDDACNISTIIKVWTEEYPLDFLYFGNMLCNLEFEIIIFDVGWKYAEFVQDQVSRLSLEDKVDFQKGGIVTGLGQRI